MNTNDFSWARVGRLLRYDWALDRSRYRTTLIIIGVIYLALMLTTLCRDSGLMHSLLGLAQPAASRGGITLPALGMVGSYVASYFGYAAYAIVIVATVTLHRKFTQPQTATAYLTLPGTRREKFVVQCLHYAAAYASVWALYLVAFYATMAVGQLRYPEAGPWLATNPLLPVSMDDVMEGLSVGFTVEGAAVDGDPAGHLVWAVLSEVRRLYALSTWMHPFAVVLGIALYASLNLCFRHNGQLKAIALIVGAYIVLLFLGIFGSAGLVAACYDYAARTGLAPIVVFGRVGHALGTTIEAILWLMPLLAAGALALLGRQVARKQAK